MLVLQEDQNIDDGTSQALRICAGSLDIELELSRQTDPVLDELLVD
jgi:hypothetical protein